MSVHLNTSLIPDDATVFDLSQPVSARSPHMPGSQPAYQMTLWTTSDRTRSILRRHGVTNDPGVNVELATTTYHVGTHVDALGHFSCGEYMHGGLSVDETVGDLGLRDLDAAKIPSMIGRAVLLDVSKLDGGDYLEGGRPISDKDLDQVVQANQIEIKKGDVVILHTGWGRFYGDRRSDYATRCPGLTLEGAQYLTQKSVVAIGADTMAVEVMPGVDPKIVMPVHVHTLVDNGVYLIENLNTDALAVSGATTFTLMMLPLNLQGATASPVRPLAVL
ncbi:cyclase family protein [Orrella sp. 11846]|uniref:cyclase family protein n=1 Tax=Orrella sp. 11846 TaxID=3409913 RepID=UPI003B58FED7